MKVLSDIRLLQDTLKPLREQGKSIGFVPTMGALHAGHGSLIKKARETCDIVVSSIFVNPTQFNDPSDFERYPRTLEKDSAYLESIGCDVVFAPKKEEVYGFERTQALPDPGALVQVMEGKFREGHFEGVMDVVHRLFTIVQPDKAFFVFFYPQKTLNFPVLTT